MSEASKATKKKTNRKVKVDYTTNLIHAAIDRVAKEQGDTLRKVLILLSAISVVMVVFAGYQITRPPLPPQVYAAERETGRVTELVPYAVIPANPGLIYNAFQRFTTILFSMNAFNYREQFDNNIRPIFSDDEAYLDFLESVRNSSWFSDMVQNEMQMRASMAGAPVIIDQGVFSNGEGQYWDVNAPVYIRLEAAGLQPISERRILTLRITHSPSREHRDGLSVNIVRINRG